MAMRASAACTLPTCLCSGPPGTDEDFKQGPIFAHRGSLSVARQRSRFTGGDLRSSRGLRSAHPLLFRMGSRSLAHPSSIGMRILPCLQTLAITRTIALQHCLKLTPVNRAKPVVLTPSSLRNCGSGMASPETPPAER